MAKRKTMTMKQLHDRMAVACRHCRRPKDEHIPIMVPDTVQYRCLDANVLDSETCKTFEI